MKTIDIKELIKNLKLDDALCEAFAEKLGKSKEELKVSFNQIIDKEISNIGKAMLNSSNNPQSMSRLRGLSLDDFMKDNDKIIKDK